MSSFTASSICSPWWHLQPGRWHLIPGNIQTSSLLAPSFGVSSTQDQAGPQGSEHPICYQQCLGLVGHFCPCFSQTPFFQGEDQFK